MSFEGVSIPDVCIVGAGPAGLSAALVLGRCARQVVVFDSGKPRNLHSRALHGYLTRDGMHPVELRGFGRRELGAYPTVQVHDLEVTDVGKNGDAFEINLANGSRWHARIVLLATGRLDRVPAKEGFSTLYGRGVYHCPYCDGWEHRGESIVVHGHGENSFDQALLLLTWSHKVTLCSDGPHRLTPAQRGKLEANGVRVIESEIANLRGDEDGGLNAVIFRDREPLECGALFFCSDCVQKSLLPEDLGCEFDAEGSVKCDGHAATNVPGLYVAGNVRGGIHLAIVAAAEGAEAAIAINRALHERMLK